MAQEICNESDDHQYVDWRGRIANPRKHGGSKAATFACVVEVIENMVFLSNATNFVTYFMKSMHYEAAKSANMVTNFMATSFLLTIVGGFISDSFLTRPTTFFLSSSIELLGLILLTIQAHSERLQPVALNKKPSGSQAAILYGGLYAMATGVGGIKASLQANGADQIDHKNQRLVSSFFNWFFFSLCTGGLIAATVMVWIQENYGWNLNFFISAIALAFSILIFTSGLPFYRIKRPAGSSLTRIFKVLFSAVRNRKASAADLSNRYATSDVNQMPMVSDGESHKFKFLEKALIDGKTSAAEVDETKAFLGLLPIFATTIMMNCCLAQLQTFSVQQGNTMNRTIHNFKIPTQSLSVFPLLIMLSSIPLYERLRGIFTNTYRSKRNLIFQPLWRIGLGLSLASASMATAAIVEVKRREAAENDVAISVFWLGWQYLLLGVSDMLTLGGMLEFFYSEAPEGMRSMSTALSWCSASIGYFLSSVLVTITNSISRAFGHEWLGGSDLKHTRLDLFYTLLCLLNFLNLLNYIYWAKHY